MQDREIEVDDDDAYVVVTNDQLSLLFNADKLLDFLTKLSAVSKIRPYKHSISWRAV